MYGDTVAKEQYFKVVYVLSSTVELTIAAIEACCTKKDHLFSSTPLLRTMLQAHRAEASRSAESVGVGHVSPCPIPPSLSISTIHFHAMLPYSEKGKGKKPRLPVQLVYFRHCR